MANYTPLTYLQTDRNCWFDTGIIPDINTKIEMSVGPLSQGINWPGFIGAQERDDAPSSFQIRGQGTDNYWGITIGNQGYSDSVNIIAFDGTMYDVSLSTSGWIINGTTVTAFTPSTFDTCSYSIYISAVHNNQGAFRPAIAKFGEVKIYSGSTLLGDFVPAYDISSAVCFYDKVTETFKYNLGGGTPIAGPVAHIFMPTKSRLSFAASGGTQSFSVDAQTGWTCTTPSAFTFTTTSGESGTTTIVATTVSANTGSTKIEETITFTDDDDYTFTVKLVQKKPSAGGTSSIYIGENNLTQIYVGSTELVAVYIGETQMFSPTTQPDNQIWYTTSDGNILVPSGLTPTANTYTGGLGVMSFSDAVTGITNSKAFGDTTIRSISLPKNCRVFGIETFMDCPATAITMVNSKSGVTISNNTFRGAQFTKCPFGKRIGTFGNSCFRGSALTAFTLNPEISTINDAAFRDCTGLTKMVFPASVENIMTEAFWGCTGITEYDFTAASAVPYLEHIDAFSGINANCKIKVPASLYDSWIAANNWSEYADYITCRLDPISGAVIAVYNIASAGSATILGSTSNLSSMVVDDGASESVSTSYNFATAGKHTIVFYWNNSSGSIPRGMVGNNTNIIELYLGEGTTAGGSDLFEGDTNLTFIYFPSTFSLYNKRAAFCNTTSLVNMSGTNVTEGKYYIVNNELWGVGCGNSVIDLSNTNITKIANYATYGNFPNLTKVILPSTVTDMSGEGNFNAQLPLLTEIVSYATSCPSTHNQLWQNAVSNGILKVPQGSTASYTSGWPNLISKGWTIQEMS